MRTRIATALFLALVLAASDAAAQAPFTVGGVTAQPGTTVYGELQVPARGQDAGTFIPFSIVNGARPGPGAHARRRHARRRVPAHPRAAAAARVDRSRRSCRARS